MARTDPEWLELEGVLKALLQVEAAARAFLHEADVAYDLDDPTMPTLEATTRLEEALQALDAARGKG